MNSINNKGQHLTIDHRNAIEEALKYENTLKDIAKRLNKDPTTVSKEIKRNRVLKESRADFRGGCIHKKTYKKKHLCNSNCNLLCKRCKTRNCFKICLDFEIKQCKRLQRFPHVCNGCEKKTTCKLDKYKYSAKVAEANYRDILETSRNGVRLSQAEIKAIDALVSPLVKKGQPLSHIYFVYKEMIPCSERTLYNLIDQGLLEIKNIDLRRKVGYRTRKKKKVASDKGRHRINRSYKDFKKILADRPKQRVVEMDTVIGRKGGKTLMTLLFRENNFMLAKLLEKNTQRCVIDTFNEISNEIGLEEFRVNFPLVITDNGSEFLNFKDLEEDPSGHLRTNIFYCDPMASHQKAQLEKNHEYIRYILPKGSSFDDFTQDNINEMMNQINNVTRKKLNHLTPYQIAKKSLSQKLLKLFDVKEIAPEDVILKEELLYPDKIKRTLLEGLK